MQLKFKTNSLSSSKAEGIFHDRPTGSSELWYSQGIVGSGRAGRSHSIKTGWALLPCGWVEEAVPGFCLELRNPQERQPRGAPHGA